MRTLYFWALALAGIGTVILAIPDVPVVLAFLTMGIGLLLVMPIPTLAMYLAAFLPFGLSPGWGRFALSAALAAIIAFWPLPAIQRDKAALDAWLQQNDVPPVPDGISGANIVDLQVADIARLSPACTDLCDRLLRSGTARQVRLWYLHQRNRPEPVAAFVDGPLGPLLVEFDSQTSADIAIWRDEFARYRRSKSLPGAPVLMALRLHGVRTLAVARGGIAVVPPDRPLFHARDVMVSAPRVPVTLMVANAGDMHTSGYELWREAAGWYRDDPTALDAALTVLGVPEVGPRPEPSSQEGLALLRANVRSALAMQAEESRDRDIAFQTYLKALRETGAPLSSEDAELVMATAGEIWLLAKDELVRLALEHPSLRADLAVRFLDNTEGRATLMTRDVAHAVMQMMRTSDLPPEASRANRPRAATLADALADVPAPWTREELDRLFALRAFGIDVASHLPRRAVDTKLIDGVRDRICDVPRAERDSYLDPIADMVASWAAEQRAGMVDREFLRLLRMLWLGGRESVVLAHARRLQIDRKDGRTAFVFSAQRSGVRNDGC